MILYTKQILRLILRQKVRTICFKRYDFILIGYKLVCVRDDYQIGLSDSPKPNPLFKFNL